MVALLSFILNYYMRLFCMAKNKKIKLERMPIGCDPFLDEDIGMLDKEQIKIEGFIDDKKCEIRYGRGGF